MELSQSDLAAMFNRIAHVQDMGGTIESAHPITYKNVQETPYSNWVESGDPRDIDPPPPQVGGRNCVLGRIIRLDYLDEYGEPSRPSEYILQHKYEHPQRKSKDVSTTPLQPRTMAGEKNADGGFTMLPLKRRFPDAFEQFEGRLRREGKPLPVALLDSIPPEVIEALVVLGIHDVQSFADASDEVLRKLASHLESNKYATRAGNVVNYRDRARDYVGEAPKRGKRAA